MVGVALTQGKVIIFLILIHDFVLAHFICSVPAPKISWMFCDFCLPTSHQSVKNAKNYETPCVGVVANFSHRVTSQNYTYVGSFCTSTESICYGGSVMLVIYSV